ncbi:MAG: methionine adenosyltransferase, partial [Ruminococcaceae bacterium]|nr:methionine adenosyltransferase [Oscillospiraceae bacterium]
AKPVSVLVDTFGTAKVDEDKISEYVYTNIDLRPSAIINKFNLRRPIYRQLAAYGHVGREDLDIPWEKTDIADDIKKALLK